MVKAESRAEIKSKQSKKVSDVSNRMSANQKPAESNHTWRDKKPGLCFACGKPGHCSFECREFRRDRVEPKISQISFMRE